MSIRRVSIESLASLSSMSMWLNLNPNCFPEICFPFLILYIKNMHPFNLSLFLTLPSNHLPHLSCNIVSIVSSVRSYNQPNVFFLSITGSSPWSVNFSLKSGWSICSFCDSADAQGTSTKFRYRCSVSYSNLSPRKRREAHSNISAAIPVAQSS